MAAHDGGLCPRAQEWKTNEVKYLPTKAIKLRSLVSVGNRAVTLRQSVYHTSKGKKAPGGKI